MQLDTDKNGLEAIFRAWQVPLIEELFNRKLISREAHEFLKELGISTGGKGRGLSPSRASVINFLNELVDLGLLAYDTRTGKGGYYRIYKMTFTREEFNHELLARFVLTLQSIFPQESKTFMWPRYSTSLRGD